MHRLLRAVRYLLVVCGLYLVAGCSDQGPAGPAGPVEHASPIEKTVGNMPVVVDAVPLAGAVNPNARALLSHRTTENVVDDTETFGQASVSDFSRTDLPAEDQRDQLDVDLEGDEFDVVAPTDELEPIYDDLIALGPLEEGDAVFALKDLDPLVRAHGVWNLKPQGEGLDHLLNAVALDPDPLVRIAAIASLEESEDFAAIRAVVDALNDPHPDVVLAAIDGLEFAGDSSNVRDLEPLLIHEDERVSEAAAQAIEYLRR